VITNLENIFYSVIFTIYICLGNDIMNTVSSSKERTHTQRESVKLASDFTLCV